MGNEYRQNVGLVILNNGLIFAGFRGDVDENSKTGWQMPQGGVDDGEEIIDACYRELFEETGIAKDKIKFRASMPYSLKYDFDKDYLKKHVGTKFERFKGQEQFWFVFEFIGNDNDINLHATSEKPEFSKWEWKRADFLLENIIEFKKNVYKQLFLWMEDEKLM